jgi:hypothetical protein
MNDNGQAESARPNFGTHAKTARTEETITTDGSQAESARTEETITTSRHAIRDTYPKLTEETITTDRELSTEEARPTAESAKNHKI